MNPTQVVQVWPSPHKSVHLPASTMWLLRLVGQYKYIIGLMCEGMAFVSNFEKIGDLVLRLQWEHKRALPVQQEGLSYQFTVHYVHNVFLYAKIIKKSLYAEPH
jgi:hypothetical protein